MGLKFNPLTLSGFSDTGPAPGASGANTNLSNLTAPTAINEDLIFDTPKNIGDAAGGNVDELYLQHLYDPDGNRALDVASRALKDQIDNPSINYQSRVMFDSATTSSIEWDGRENKDVLGTISLNWNSRQLRDSDGLDSADWDARQLINAAADILLSWDTTSLIAQNINPDSNGARTLGTAGGVAGWQTINLARTTDGVVAQFHRGSVKGDIQVNATTPSGAPAAVGFTAQGGQIAALFTSNEAGIATGGLYLETGNRTGAAGATGLINIKSGDSTGASGDLSISSGAVTTSTSGNISVVTGSPSGAGTSGNLTLQSGNGNATGQVTIKGGNTTGNNVTSGGVAVSSGNSSLGGSGNISLTTGSTDPAGGQTAGSIDITTGVGSPGGTIEIETGNSVLSGNNGPNMTFITGSAQVDANGGNFVFNAGIGNGTGHDGDMSWSVRRLLVPYTVTAGGVTGDQAIHTMSGTVNFAAAASTLTVTNDRVTADSLVFAVVRTDDATAAIKNVVPAAGSFVITLSAAATAETSVGWWVINE